MAASASEPGIGRVPLDSDGYVVAFKSSEEAEYKAFFERWGFVVIEGALTADECQATLEEIWQEIERPEHQLELDEWPTDGEDTAALKQHFRELLQAGASGGDEPVRWRQTGAQSVAMHISRRAPVTWANAVWPGIVRLGILQGRDWANGPAAWHNRQKPEIYEVFRSLLGTEQLWCTFDRHGLMRPTSGGDGRPCWKTEARWLHWDMNPWNGLWSLYGIDTKDGHSWSLDEPALRLQGLLNITDARKEDGGFYTVPGCKHALADWSRRNQGDYMLRMQHRNFVPVPTDDQELYPMVQEIPARAGSLIIWDSRQAHSNHPNASDRFRVVQYLTMIDARLPIRRDVDASLVAKCLPPGFELTELGRRLVGVEPWTNDEEQTTCQLL